MLPGGRLDADLWTDDAGRMIRFSVPLQSLEVVREDIAAVSSRSVTISRPNDQQVNIPSNGFSLAGTLSKPRVDRHRAAPAGASCSSAAADRPIATASPSAFRFSARSPTPSPTPATSSSATTSAASARAAAAPNRPRFTDYADDVRAAVKLLADRKDVDPKRIAVVGHSEGGLVALMAAAKDKKIAAVGLIATPGITGAEVVLAQQKRLLDRTKLTPEEKQAKVDEQKTDSRGGDHRQGPGAAAARGSPRRSTTPEFQGILTSDPAKLVPQVQQPLLIVQGGLDTQVEPQNADALEALARKRKNAPPVEVVKVPAINHLLVPATTGEVSEYADLKDKHVSGAVTQAIVTWLNKTLSTAR